MLLRCAPLCLTLLALAGCSGGSPATGATPVAVTATDDQCKVPNAPLPAGRNVLAIENAGSKVTEVYVYGQGDRTVAEKEDIGPGVTARLTVDLPAGSYTLVCKPGMTGDGIRTPITVG